MTADWLRLKQLGIDMNGVKEDATDPPNLRINDFILSCLDVDTIVANLSTRWEYGGYSNRCSEIEKAVANDHSVHQYDILYPRYSDLRRIHRELVLLKKEQINKYLAFVDQKPISFTRNLRDSIERLIDDFGARISMDGRIQLLIRDVVLTNNYIEHDFGNYMIEIKPYNVLSYIIGRMGGYDHHEIYKIYTNDAEKAMLNGTTISHPHICDNNLCEGEGYTAIRSAIKRGDLLSMFLIIEGIVRSYNEEGAYKRLERWKNYYCSHCDYDFSEDDDGGSSCDMCNALVCSECGRPCNCGNYMCNSCTITCAACAVGFCEDCNEDVDRCAYCLDDVCVNCSTHCAHCDKIYCTHHLRVSKCSRCSKLTCRSCSLKCSLCNAMICPDCELLCDSCSASICKDCITMCEHCGNNFCERCITDDNYCKDCDQDIVSEEDEIGNYATEYTTAGYHSRT